MDQDLRFRYQQHDGRNTLAVALVTMAAGPLAAFIGWPLVVGAAGVTLGFVLARLTHH